MQEHYPIPAAHGNSKNKEGKETEEDNKQTLFYHFQNISFSFQRKLPCSFQNGCKIK